MARKRRRQEGSLKKLAHRDGRLWWRFQWRKPGEKNATTKWLGQCSKMSKKAAEAEGDRILKPINDGLEIRVSPMMTLTEFIDTTYLDVKRLVWRADSTRDTSSGCCCSKSKPDYDTSYMEDRRVAKDWSARNLFAVAYTWATNRVLGNLRSGEVTPSYLSLTAELRDIKVPLARCLR